MNDAHLLKKTLSIRSGEIIYYADMSFPGRPTAVLLHGLSSNHTTWLNAMRVLHAHRYNSIAPDLRGHGFSDKTKDESLYELSVFSEDLHDMARQEGLENFTLAGYSFGGGIAMDYAARYPESVNGLILISVNHKEPLYYLGLRFLTPVVVGFFNLLALFLLWQKRSYYHYYEHGKAVGYFDSVWDGLRTMPISVNFWMLAKTFNINLGNVARRIKAPVVIMYGKHDAFVRKAEIDDMVREIPQAQVVISDNKSHFVGSNSQDETTELIVNFLRKHENSAI